MKRWILAGLLFGLVACKGQVDRPNDGKPRVVSTSTIIANLAARVGGQKIDHRGILQPGTDPHVYEPVPADSIALEQADVILYNGYNLEPGLIKLMNSAGVNAKKVAVGEVAKPLDFDKEGQKVADPHVWGDASNGIAMVEKIRDELSQLSPEDQAVFAANADRLIADLEKVDTWIKASIQTIPSDRRRIVTTHDAFQYYANAYGLKVIGTLIGISTEEQPSARTVKDLALAIQKAQVPAIFAETTINPALITTVAQEAGVKLAPRQLYSDSIGAPGTEADSYEKMLAANTKTIVEALGGKVLPSPK
jgi:manganese/iron transport system substrate-binding protein